MSFQPPSPNHSEHRDTQDPPVTHREPTEILGDLGRFGNILGDLSRFVEIFFGKLAQVFRKTENSCTPPARAEHRKLPRHFTLLNLLNPFPPLVTSDVTRIYIRPYTAHRADFEGSTATGPVDVIDTTVPPPWGHTDSTLIQHPCPPRGRP